MDSRSLLSFPGFATQAWPVPAPGILTHLRRFTPHLEYQQLSLLQTHPPGGIQEDGMLWVFQVTQGQMCHRKACPGAHPGVQDTGNL